MKWDFLKKHIRGKVVTAIDSNFKAVSDSMVWNQIKPNRSPKVIVTVKDESDIITAINFARENNLKVTVHGGGHTWSGLAIRQDGMTIDLSELTLSVIDKSARKAIIQPVISNRDLAQRLSKEDLAFPIGHCPTVKASGYLLSGGMSWNLSEWGPACRSIEAIEFITAEGKKIIANENDYADLFWAARGAGPGMFAIATKFHLRCYSLPTAIMTSSYYFSLDDLQEVVAEATQLGWKMPRIVELSIFLIQAPPELHALTQKHNEKLCMVTAVAFANTKTEGIAALNILQSEKILKKCLAKKINEESNFEKLAEVSGIIWPEHHRNLCENLSSNANPVDIFMALRDKIIAAPSKKSVIVFCQSTGQHNLVETNDDIAFSMSGRSYGGCWSIWEKPADDAVNMNWHDDVVTVLKPFTNKHYIGETDFVQDRMRAQNSFTPEKWQRLETIRKKYDPDGLFFNFLGGI